MLGIRPLINLAVGGSCSVFEITHSVYKYATNRFSFRARPTKPVILSVVEGSRGNETTDFCARTIIINYSLLIIHFSPTTLFAK